MCASSSKKISSEAVTPVSSSGTMKIVCIQLCRLVYRLFELV
jgi:hypothetical protein